MGDWVSNGNSGSGSLHSGKDLTSVSEVPLAPAGLTGDYMDPVTRHIRGTPAYNKYKQYVKNLNLPSSVASSPASLQWEPHGKEDRDAHAFQLDDV